MDSATTVLAGHKELATAIKTCVRNVVLQVDPHFIDLAEPGFTKEFEPQFRIVNANVEKGIRALQGEVIYALPPGLTSGDFLYHVAYTLQDRPITILHAPLHSLRLEDIRHSLDTAERLDPWLITSVAARRVTEQLVGLRLAPQFSAKSLPYTGWQSLFYLCLISNLGRPSWTRTLRFGECKAPEIDSFGGAVYHHSYPSSIDGEFVVTHKETESQYPDLRFGLNHILRGSKEKLDRVCESLQKAYFSGSCSWPFAYGGVHFGEGPIEAHNGRTGVLQNLSGYKQARKVVRLYRNSRALFRSVSYYPKTKDFVPENPVPAKSQVKITTDPRLPRTTLDSLLERLSGFHLNLDFPSILKLFCADYVHQEGNQLAITQKGEGALHCLKEIGIGEHRLYLILRALESIQTDEASYSDVLAQIAKTLQP
jgi:hypothetical protein